MDVFYSFALEVCLRIFVLVKRSEDHTFKASWRGVSLNHHGRFFAKWFSMSKVFFGGGVCCFWVNYQSWWPQRQTSLLKQRRSLLGLEKFFVKRPNAAQRFRNFRGDIGKIPPKLDKVTPLESSEFLELPGITKKTSTVHGKHRMLVQNLFVSFSLVSKG